MAQIRTKKQFEQKRKDDRRQERIKKFFNKPTVSPKGLAKTALKATPPGMMLTAAQKIKEEFNRLTKPRKKPEAKTGPVKKSRNTTVKNKNIIKGPKKSTKKRTNKKRKM